MGCRKGTLSTPALSPPAPATTPARYLNLLMPYHHVSFQAKVGDSIDLISETVDDGQRVKVKRVRIVKVGASKTSKDKTPVYLRCWRGNTLIDNPDKGSDKWNND